MNGNSRRKSETESSSSLESRDPLRRSSSSDSLRRYTYLPTPSYAHTHTKKLSTLFDVGYMSQALLLINEKSGPASQGSDRRGGSGINRRNYNQDAYEELMGSPAARKSVA
ncbi:hypothetical protein DY000_02023946 [Brassica cretica]|uniref:DUF4005 domain-containing protein n=1 Tax=Brassica cretica TaxID=69181 RepID=A0ABQ7E8J9_BRACR|nr:hypothetical protein DY000_02023946 [Brassica cretica]